MRKEKLFACAAMLGIVLGFIAGTVNTTPNVLGASWYGWPVAWRFVVVYPGSPTTINASALGADILFWVLVAAIVLAFLNKVAGGAQRKQTRARRKSRR